MGSGGVRPSGTVTFLFTDIEGSTTRWEADPEAMRVELAAHDEVLRAAVEAEGGWLFKHTGDGVCAAFQSAQAAVDAAIGAQRALGLPVRMGIASGEAEFRGDDYFGSTLNKAAQGDGRGSWRPDPAGGVHCESGARRRGGRSRVAELAGPVGAGAVVPGPRRWSAQRVPGAADRGCGAGNLPVQESSFVGRDDAVATIVDAVGEHRVVTLIGVGGVGKTRLAVQSAAMLAPRFRDGVWLIELAPVTDGDGVDACGGVGVHVAAAT